MNSAVSTLLRSDLPKLTKNQQSYADGRLAGLNQADSYREAYNAENMNDNSIWVEASRLDSHPKVALWLDYHRAELQERAKIDIDSHLTDLLIMRDTAFRKDQIATAITAEKARGEVAGFYNKHGTVGHYSIDGVGSTKSALPKMIEATAEVVKE